MRPRVRELCRFHFFRSLDGILGVVPELERGLGNFEPGDIVRLNFQMQPANREGAAFGRAHPNARLLG
jgi:hypothetical protein